MLRNEDVDAVVGASLVVAVVVAARLGLEGNRAVDGLRHRALIGMRDGDILHGTGDGICRSGFSLLGIVHQGGDADELSRHGLVVQGLIADSVFQGEEVVPFGKWLRSGKGDVEGGTFDHSLAHLRGAKVQRSLGDKCGGLASREGHLRHLHSRLGVERLHGDGQHVLFGITGGYGLRRGGNSSQTVEVHRLGREEAYFSLEAIGSNIVAGITEEHHGQRAIVGCRAHDARLALLQGAEQVLGFRLTAAIDAQFLIIVGTMPDLVHGEIDHHLLSLDTREEGHLAVGLRHDAAILAALVVEPQGCLTDGDGLRCGRHDDQGRVLHFDGRSSGEGSNAIGLARGRDLGDVNLHLGTHGSRAENVALDSKGGGVVGKGLTEGELIVSGGHADHSGIELRVALEELQGCGINHAFVLGHGEEDGRDVVGVHHALGSDIGIGQRHVLLSRRHSRHAVVVAASTRDGHVLQRDAFHFSHPAVTSFRIAPQHANRQRAVGHTRDIGLVGISAIELIEHRAIRQRRRRI